MRALAFAAALLATAGGAAAATLQPHTVNAWEAYVAAAEARLAAEEGRPTAVRAPEGESVDVPDGLISHWRGSIFVPNVTLDALLQRLQHPSEHGPHQEDVLNLRVLQRRPSALTLAIRMQRTKIVTVTYDTRHEVHYRRLTGTRASSRSIATRIVELDGAGTPREHERPEGQDRGFLWRMNSYWTYETSAGGVIVTLESLTLSRGIPTGLGVVARPIINRIARESMDRTLQHLRETYTPA